MHDAFVSNLESFAALPPLLRCAVCGDGCVAAAASWSQQQFSPAWVKSHQRDTAATPPHQPSPPSSNRHQSPGEAVAMRPSPRPCHSGVIVIITGHCPMSHVPCRARVDATIQMFRRPAQLSYFPRGWAAAARSLVPSSNRHLKPVLVTARSSAAGRGLIPPSPGYQHQQPFLPPDMEPGGHNCI